MSAAMTRTCGPSCAATWAPTCSLSLLIITMPERPSKRNANCFTISVRHAIACIRTVRAALLWRARAAGFISAFEQVQNVGQGRLVAVMPIGALGAVGIEMLLVEGGVGGFGLEPLPDVVATAEQQRHFCV